MKALKEKRVSLRSLFRRSLVILSLLALAFASCSDSGGSDSTPSTPTPSNPGPQTPVRSVKSLTIMEYPYLPSYEGAYPDLTGLKVQIKWSDDVVDYEVDTSKFVVYPSVAYVTAPDTSESEFSKFNQYGIQYMLDPYYNPSGPKVNVYIPAVIAIEGGSASFTVDDGSGYDVAKISGTLPKVFEDQDIDPAPLELWANYKNDVTSAPTQLPAGYYSPYLGRTPVTDDEKKEFKAWPTNAAPEVLNKRISANRDAWRISQDPNDKTVEYLLRSVNGSALIAKTVKVDKFYYVDSITLTGGDFTKIQIFADNPDFNEYTDPRVANGTPTTYPNDFFTTNTLNEEEANGNPYRKDVDLKVGENWYKQLYKAGLKFKVTYYDPSDPNGSTGETRNIDMDDYTRAMYTTDSNGNAKATLPIPTGRGQSTTTPANKRLLISDVITSVAEEYPLSLRLYYYNRLIKGGKGQGLCDLKISYDSGNGVYVKPNYVTVPITANNVIYTYSGISKDRIENTNFDNNDIPARVPNDLNLNQVRRSAYDALKTYYKVEYTYSNEARGDSIKAKAPWRPYADLTPITATDTLFDGGFENEAAEEEEARTCAMIFNLPVSAQIGGDTEDVIEFPYLMMP